MGLYLRPEEREEIIHSIDSSLRIVKPFKDHSGRSSGTCKVRRQGSERDLVLRWEIQRNELIIQNAARAIRETPEEYKGVEVVNVYDGDLPALLKTFLPGSEGSTIFGYRNIPRRHYKTVRRCVDMYHTSGIAGVDPHAGNLLFEKGRFNGFFDFDLVEFIEINREEYRKRVSIDLNNLENAFESRTSAMIRRGARFIDMGRIRGLL